VIAVDVINGHLSRMPALRPLVLIVKAFLAQKDLNCAAKSGLSSYALICMAISFLQVRIPLPQFVLVTRASFSK
jgi:non-canonical poly(A) RNA polymerase PAPD5/7